MSKVRSSPGRWERAMTDISQETDVRAVGAICIACGFRPEAIVAPAANHRFRPVEWRWAIKPSARL